MHLWWTMPPAPLAEVSAVCEVLVPPGLARLYFWALQASFVDGERPCGTAHLGLQWNPRFPGSCAANWGGYRPSGDGLLAGTESELPSTPGDPNTRDYHWWPNQPYRFRIHRSPQGWRGEITDLATGSVTVVRDLLAGGDRLTLPVVWSEVFAPCEAPSAMVRWSELRGVMPSGEQVIPQALRVNYQEPCHNTTVQVDELGIRQLTNAERVVPQGEIVPLLRT